MNLTRNRLASLPRTILIAAVAIGVTWGGLAACRSTNSREDLSDRLQEVIADVEKREKLDEIITRRNRAQDEFMSGRRKLTEKLMAANSDYDCDQEKLDAIVAEFDSSWRVFREKVISTTLELRESTTASEWQALAPADIEAILSESVIGEHQD